MKDFPVFISGIITQSRLSREQITERMTQTTGDEITVNMLNAWTAESKKQHRFPLEYAAAFCQAVGNTKLLDYLLQEMGLVAISEKEQLLFDILRNEKAIEDLKRRNTRLKRKYNTGQMCLFDEE